ncbi:MAG: protein kinase domain-containing protein [Planctomycetia bacterium]
MKHPAAVRGGSLEAEEWSLRLRRQLRSYIVVCQTIHYAHGRGVLHRDIKPHNIMLGRHGETIVVDWGLAKSLGDAPAANEGGRQKKDATESRLRVASPQTGDLTMAGSLLGTPAYMSPEQAAGRTASTGPASDIYSLGATLYHLLAGQPPFRGDDLGQVLRDVQAGRYPSPRMIQPLVPRGLESIAAKAMARAPADRYMSSAALADDVENWLADQPFAAHRERSSERIFRWIRRHRAWAVAGFSAVAATALVALAAVKVVDGQRRVAHKLAAEKTSLAEAERKERELAITGIRRARAGALAANSRALKRTRPELGVLLAIEAVRTTTRHGLPIMPAAEESLREALMEIGGVPFHPPEPVLALSAAGRWLVCTTQFFDMDGLDPAATGQAHGVQAALAATSADESRLALVAADGGITVVDPNDAVREPVVIASLAGPFVPEQATLRLSPNGRWLFFAANGTGRLHDLHDGASPAVGRTGTILEGVAATAVFSPDSGRLAMQAVAPTDAAGDTVQVWRLGDEPAEPLPLVGGAGHRPLAFSPDSRELVTREGDKDSRVMLWNLESPGPGAVIATVPGEATALYQGHGDRLLLTERKGRLKGWRLLSRQPKGDWLEKHVVETHSPEEHFSIACSDTWLVASLARGEIYAWNLADAVDGWKHSDLPTCTLRGHRYRASQLAFSRDGRRLISVDEVAAKTWDFTVPHPEVINQTLAPRPGTLLARPDAPAGGATGERVMSPDGHWLAIDGEDKVVRVLDLTSDDPLRSPLELVGHDGKVVFHTFSPDGRWLATGGADHTVCVWDLSQLPAGTGQTRLATRPAVRFSTDGVDPACLRFGVEPGQLWTAGPSGGGGAIVLWEWSPVRPDGAIRRAQVTGIAVQPRLAFSLTADALTVSMRDGTVQRHRLRQGVPVDAPEPVAEGMAAIVPPTTWTGRGTGPFAKSPDGRWRTEVSPGEDIDLIRIEADGREVKTRLLQDREAEFQCAAFSGDSELLATGYSDGSLQVWDLRAEEVTRSGSALRGHIAPVQFIEFDRSDRWLVSSSPTSVRLWEMDADRLIAMGRRAIGRTLTDYERAQFGIDEPAGR